MSKKESAGSSPAARHHGTVAERLAAGRAARTAATRSGHGGWTPPEDRQDPVAILLGQAEERIGELVPIRHARMAMSPFAFYRGAAAIMAADLASTPSSGITAQLCGDAHLSNFGVFAAPDRRLVFDVNDFDETHPGPWEWDLKRLAASIVIAARGLGYGKGAARSLVLVAMAGYRQRVLELAGRSDLDAWYARIEVEQVLASLPTSALRTRMKSLAAVASERDSVHSFRKLTAVIAGERRFLSRPPLLVRTTEPDEAALLRSTMDGYAASLRDDQRELLGRYRLVDTARKVVGVGSVGLAAYAVLYQGRDDDDPLFLQLKEARPSVLAPFTASGTFPAQGHRVVAGQRLMQAASDILLGWVTDATGRDLYVRQLADQKWSLDLAHSHRDGLTLYVRCCGDSLALAHARSGDRLAIAGYLGHGDRFDRAIADFAEAYATQNQADYEAFTAAIAAGRVPVASREEAGV